MAPAMASDGGREVNGHGGARRPRSGAGGESERVCQRELGRAIMEEQERDSGRAHSSGARQWWRRAPAWLPRTGHAPPFEEFYRARGGQQSDQRGEPIWAICRPNLDMGPKAKLQPT